MAFFLNKYLSPEDIEDINQYYLNMSLHENRNYKSSKFSQGSLAGVLPQKEINIIHGETINGPSKNFFQQRYDERFNMKSQTAQKMKEI